MGGWHLSGAEKSYSEPAEENDNDNVKDNDNDNGNDNLAMTMASFADDNTPYSCLSDMIRELKGGIDKIFDWFKKRFLKGNADKCHLITSPKTSVGISVSKITIMSEEKV